MQTESGSSPAGRSLSVPVRKNAGTPSTRACAVCGSPIPANRLKAVPGADKCVPCVELSGDVLRYRRFDEYTPSGERVETLFTRNKRIEKQMRHMNLDVAADEAFITAAGELLPDGVGIIDSANHLSSEFEQDNYAEEYKTRKEKIKIYYEVAQAA